MADKNHEGEINISRIPVSGIGGLGLVVMAVVVALALPQLRWLAVLALVGGAVIGLMLIASRQHRSGPALGGLLLVLAAAVAAFLYFR